MSAYKGDRIKTTIRIPRNDYSDIQKMTETLDLGSVADYLLFAHRRLVESGIARMQDTAEANQADLPKIDSLWRHYNGNTYIVEDYSNRLNTGNYPINVLHRNIRNGKLYSRVASDWSRSFQPLPRERFISNNGRDGTFHITIPGVWIGNVTPLTECKENAWRIAEECVVDRIKDHLDVIKAGQDQLQAV